MRLLIYSLLLLGTSQLFADSPLQRLKERYNAIDQGTVVLPDLTSSQVSNKSPTPTVVIPSGEELIVSVYFDQYFLGDILGVKTDQGAAFSLLDLAMVLDFPLAKQSGDDLTVTGWIRSPNNTFMLQITDTNKSVQVGSERFTISDQSLVDLEELYIDKAALEKWLDISIEVDYQNLRASISTTNPLPLQEKIARQQRADNISPISNIAQNPLQKDVYSPLSRPLLDIQASTSYSESTGSNSNLSVLGGNDLAYFNTQYYVAASSGIGITDARLTASKISPESDLLGPLNASILEIGDIRPTSVSDALSARDGAGIRLSNERIGFQGSSTVNITGEIQPGWDIEVYRNNLLIESQANVQGGEYRFNNFPLLFGANTVELVFYGPQGQVERETQSYYIKGIDQEAGNFTYDISFFDDDTDLLDGLYDSRLQKQSYGKTLSGFGRFALTDWFSVNFGQTTHLEDQYEEYDRQAIGTTTSLFGKALLSSDYIIAPDDSTIEEYNVTTRLLGQSLQYSYTQYHQWDDTLQLWRDREEDSLSLAGQIEAINLSYQQDVDRTTNESGNRYRFRNQLATSVGPYYINHELEWFSDNEPTQGRWQLQRYIDNYFTRFGMSYVAEPQFEANGVFAEVSGAPLEDVQTKMALTRNIASNVNNIALTASWRPADFSLTSTLAYNDTSGWSTNLTGQVSIGQVENGFFTSGRSLVSQGSAAIFVYLDENNNGVFDNNDSPLPDIGIVSKQSYRKASTNQQGIALIKALPNYKQTDIEIDEATVEQPFLIPRSAGVSVIPRSGTVQQIDIPMVQSIEIEGTLFELTQDEQTTPLAFVPVQLINAKKEVVAETNTEFDGYYIFTRLVPENYSVRVNPSYVSDRNYISGPQLEISTKSAEENILAGKNLYLRKAFQRTGFSAEIRTFSSLTALRGYWNILKTKQPSLESQRYFYIQSDDTFTLYISFSDTKQMAQAICQTLAPLACRVTEVDRY